MQTVTRMHSSRMRTARPAHSLGGVREVLWPGPGGREVLWPGPGGWGGRSCDLVPGGGCCGPGPGGREGGRCCDLVPGGGEGGRCCDLWCCPPPSPRVRQTDACENITFARFATRAVTILHPPLALNFIFCRHCSAFYLLHKTNVIGFERNLLN